MALGFLTESNNTMSMLISNIDCCSGTIFAVIISCPLTDRKMDTIYYMFQTFFLAASIQFSFTCFKEVFSQLVPKAFKTLIVEDQIISILNFFNGNPQMALRRLATYLVCNASLTIKILFVFKRVFEDF